MFSSHSSPSSLYLWHPWQCTREVLSLRWRAALLCETTVVVKSPGRCYHRCGRVTLQKKVTRARAREKGYHLKFYLHFISPLLPHYWCRVGATLPNLSRPPLWSSHPGRCSHRAGRVTWQGLMRGTLLDHRCGRVAKLALERRRGSVALPSGTDPRTGQRAPTAVNTFPSLLSNLGNVIKMGRAIARLCILDRHSQTQEAMQCSRSVLDTIAPILGVSWTLEAGSEPLRGHLLASVLTAPALQRQCTCSSLLFFLLTSVCSSAPIRSCSHWYAGVDIARLGYMWTTSSTRVGVDGVFVRFPVALQTVAVSRSVPGSRSR